MKVEKNNKLNEAPEFKPSERLLARLDKLAKEYKMPDKGLANTLDHLYQINYKQLEKNSYAKDKGKYTQPVNILIVGEPGGGKTSIIEQWAVQNDIALLTITGSNLTDTIANGLPMKDEYEDSKELDAEGNPTKKARQVYLPSTVFDDLDDAEGRYSVLFIDEINRAYAEAQAALLTLIQSHKTSNFYFKGGQRKFNQFLFTIAACNPPSTDEEVETLSRALNNRFRFYPWHSDPNETKKFWDEVFDDQIAGMEEAKANGDSNPRLDSLINETKNQKLIIDTLVDSGKFSFEDTPENSEDEFGLPTRTLSSRSLASCIIDSDGVIGDIIEVSPDGTNIYTPESFLDLFQDHCGSGSFKIVEEILLEARAKQKRAEEREQRKISGAQDTLLNLWDDWKDAHEGAENEFL